MNKIEDRLTKLEGSEYDPTQRVDLDEQMKTNIEIVLGICGDDYVEKLAKVHVRRRVLAGLPPLIEDVPQVVPEKAPA